MNIDFAKRRQVMERSQLLGHCICEPKRPCPCDVFRNLRICPCAGERPERVDLTQVKLTDLVRHAGCASKIAPADLDSVLSRLPQVTDPAVISGLAAADDAAIYRISENLCLVQTVDVFTPCIDDPFLFGKICAANCLSDIYAMGGQPRTALSILAFPSETLDGEIMYQMLAGAMETLAQAGVALVGGHSIKDEEIKLGFAITGLIDPAAAAALEQPQAGDILVLTKPLGTGVLTFCQQIGRSCPTGMAEAARSMTLLNKAASEAMREAGASACTDITGFGLAGHAAEMAAGDRCGLRLAFHRIPLLPSVADYASMGLVPEGTYRNREGRGHCLRGDPSPLVLDLLFDPQTSGGLLAALPGTHGDAALAALLEAGVDARIIGSTGGEPGTVEILP